MGEAASRAMSWHRRVLLLLLVLLAFALRVWNLGAQDLRGDEAFDVVFTRFRVSEILQELRSTQPYPPAYPLFFKAWVSSFGQSEFALRFPALWCSVLTVPVIVVLARFWLGERTAHWVGLLMALQPLAIWYAQDGRMYAQLLFFPLAATWFAAQLWAGRRAAWIWVAYASAAFLGVLFHYMAVLPLAAFQVCALWVAWRERDGPFLARWSIAQVGIALAYAPWLWFAWPLLRSHTSSWVQPVSWLAMLWQELVSYTVGLTLDWRWALGPALVAGISAAVACVALWRSGQRRVLLFLLFTLGVPIGLVAVASLRRPMFSERYLFFMTAPLLILIGHGLSCLSQRRWLVVTLSMLVVGGMWLSFVQYRFNPAYAKSPPWRAMFAYLGANIEDRDVVVYTFPDPAPEVYTAGRWPIQILPVAFPPDAGDVSARVALLAQDYERVWLIPQWSPQWDEEGLVEDELDAACERVAELRAGTWPLVLYETPVRFGREMRPLGAVLDGDIRLLGYTLRDEQGSTHDRVQLRPGAEAHLTLYWRAEAAIERDYKVFVHLLDSTGWLRGQQDNQPREGTWPTTMWLPGAAVVDIYHIPLATDAPPGDYLLEVGMYRGEDGTRLTTSGLDADPANRRVVLRDLVRVQ